ncbi:MAG: hypothetical protein U0903_13585 [Planctomycetales bacterium]
MWEFHWAYYYKQLSLLGAIDEGFNDYFVTTISTSASRPGAGMFQFAYFLTGEEVERRTFVEPLRLRSAGGETRGRVRGKSEPGSITSRSETRSLRGDWPILSLDQRRTRSTPA